MALHASEQFGLDVDNVLVREGDSDALVTGGGTGGSKSLLTSSVALQQAVAEAIAKGRALVAHK